MPLLDLVDAGVSFGGAAPLAGLRLGLYRGERLGVAGGAGAGKTLIALRIAGMLPRGATPTGTLLFDGSLMPRDEDVLVKLRGRRIGFMFGDGRTALDPSRRLEAQIGVLAERTGGPEELLRQLDLGSLKGRFPHELDEAARRRALLAMSLAQEPDILVADEPAAGLDTIATHRLLELLVALQKARGFALLLLARDYRAIAMTCDRAIVLTNGRAVETGKSDIVFSRPQHEHTRLFVAASRLRMRTIARPPIGEDLLRVEGLRIDSGRESSATIGFSVRRGETVAVVGQAGAGKSQLGRVVAGLERARGGTLTLETDPYADSVPRHRRRDVSLVFADAASSFDAALPVGTALAEQFRLEPQRLHEEQGERLLEIVRAVGLDPEALTRLPGSFDAATLVRLGLARALLARPQLVVLDEPAGQLDLMQRNGLMELIARLRSDHGLSCLLLTRDIEVARDLADRALVLAGGAIVEQGKPYGLIDDPQHPVTQALVAARLPEVWNVTPSGAVMGRASG